MHAGAKQRTEPAGSFLASYLGLKTPFVQMSAVLFFLLLFSSGDLGHRQLCDLCPVWDMTV